MSDEIKKLTPYSHIRTRLNMYFGSKDICTENVLVYEKNIPNMNYKLFPNSEDINKENININNKVSEEVDDIVRRIKSMNPELYVHLTKNNPWNHIWLNNTNLKTYNIIISTSKLSTK